MYQTFVSLSNEIIIVRTIDHSFIPCDMENTDYQAYLAWVAEGNTAEEWTGN